MTVEIREVAAGLWLWRQPHWEWREGDDWEPEVSSFVVRSGTETVLLDPLAPPPSAREVWDRLEANRPTAIVVIKPDHVRDVDLFVHWYGAAASVGQRLQTAGKLVTGSHRRQLGHRRIAAFE